MKITALRYLRKKARKYVRRYRFLFKRYTHEILTSDRSDHMIALSYAIGTEIAVFPTPGFSTAIGFGLLAIFKRLNKVAVLLSMLIWNGFTVLPIYWLSFKAGKSIASSLPNIEFQHEWLNEILLFLKQFALGNLLVTIPISVFSYFLARALLRWSRERRRIKKLYQQRNN